LVYFLQQKYKLKSFTGYSTQEEREVKKPCTYGRGFFQTRKFLGYYDLILTETRAWNYFGQFKFRCKFTAKKRGNELVKKDFINRVLFKKKSLIKSDGKLIKVQKM
jgi:hypothetical protein